MTRSIFLAVAAVCVTSTSAFAWEGQVTQCYDKVWVGPKYKTTKTLVKPARTALEHRGEQLADVYYPPVYKESSHMTSKGHYIMRPGACK